MPCAFCLWCPDQSGFLLPSLPQLPWCQSISKWDCPASWQFSEALIILPVACGFFVLLPLSFRVPSGLDHRLPYGTLHGNVAFPSERGFGGSLTPHPFLLTYCHPLPVFWWLFLCQAESLHSMGYPSNGVEVCMPQSPAEPGAAAGKVKVGVRNQPGSQECRVSKQRLRGRQALEKGQGKGTKPSHTRNSGQGATPMKKLF